MRPLGTPKTPKKAFNTPQAHRCACSAAPLDVAAMLPCAGVPGGCPIGDMTTFSTCAVLVTGDAQSPSETRPSGPLTTAGVPARVVAPPPRCDSLPHRDSRPGWLVGWDGTRHGGSAVARRPGCGAYPAGLEPSYQRHHDQAGVPARALVGGGLRRCHGPCCHSRHGFWHLQKQRAVRRRQVL